MILHVEGHERDAYSQQVDQYLRLRKRVFHDMLGWEVPVHGDMEYDELDDAPCTYTLFTDADGIVRGGARLIPTTQPTLLSSYFGELMPDEINFIAPDIWESSRYCVDHDVAQARMNSGSKKATLGVSLGNYDYAIKNGISAYLAVVDARMYMLSQKYSIGVEELTRTTISGSDVVCAFYPINEESGSVAEKLRPIITAAEPTPKAERAPPEVHCA
ncbi:MAG: acyl-homoserine-lactone synthase [Pseudomonadota bacterium]